MLALAAVSNQTKPDASLDCYVLPGERVFPEGITEGPDGDFFVGSTTDGTLFRIVTNREQAEVWSPGGADSRTELLGLHVDSRRRLVACGGSTGRLFVIDVDTRALVASPSVTKAQDTCFARPWWTPGPTSVTSTSTAPACLVSALNASWPAKPAAGSVSRRLLLIPTLGP